MKEQKGITMITLIITIFVLVLLAAAAILAIRESKILEYSRNTANTYDEEVKNEIGAIGEHENVLKNESAINKNDNSSNNNNNNSNVDNNKENITFELDSIQYNAEVGMNWYNWCKSSYNTGNWKCDSLTGIVYRGSGTPSTGGITYVKNVKGNNEIVNNGEYLHAIELPILPA